jgi:phytoene dehydrogenase-like protein
VSESSYDAVVVGSGPNGLAAAVTLAQAGLRVLVVEARDSVGGGTRSAELTLPGFVHDVCSAVHPLGVLSPFFRTLPLSDHGLRWIHAPISLAHPLDDGSAGLLELSPTATGASLGADARAWSKLVEPFLHRPHALFRELLSPLAWPADPWSLARFGWLGVRSANRLACERFRSARARALFAGCAAHSILPLSHALTAAVGLVFAISGHVATWPVAQGGSHAITRALASYLLSLGGEIRLATPVASLRELPRARAYLLDLAPRQLLELAGDRLPAGYRRRLGRYRYGPAVFKLDWALAGPIPWRAPGCERASTVHLGGELEEVAEAESASWRGRLPEKPFVLVAQQSLFDPTRAPAGRHTGYAYCHVPHACPVDMTARIEAQIERFAPGFRDLILARHARAPADIERDNPSSIGGAIAGGSADLFQLFTRPVARLDPYSTPDPALFLCSHATPPGGGVHGMCGHHAARSVLQRLRKGSDRPALVAERGAAS